MKANYIRLRNIILLVYVFHAENNAKIGDQQYQGLVYVACTLHLYQSAYKLGSPQKAQ